MTIHSTLGLVILTVLELTLLSLEGLDLFQNHGINFILYFAISFLRLIPAIRTDWDVSRKNTLWHFSNATESLTHTYTLSLYWYLYYQSDGGRSEDRVECRNQDYAHEKRILPSVIWCQDICSDVSKYCLFVFVIHHKAQWLNTYKWTLELSSLGLNSSYGH